MVSGDHAKCGCPRTHLHPERLSTDHLPGESRTCPKCGGPTFVMLHDWQGGCGVQVRRSLICRAKCEWSAPAILSGLASHGRSLTPTGDLYPGRSVIVSEMADIWRRRNAARRRYVHDGHPMHLAAQEAHRSGLRALRRVWHGLRDDYETVTTPSETRSKPNE